MAKLAYDIKINCRAGTHRLVGSTDGTYWEDVYHVITWAREYSLEDALKSIKEHLANPREVKEAWYDVITV